IVSLTARLMKARGDQSGAKEFVKEYVARAEKDFDAKTNRAPKYLAFGHLFTSIGSHDEAEAWYHRLMEISPDAYLLVVKSMLEQGKRLEAADLTLNSVDGQLTPQVATVLANIVTTTTESVEPMPAVQEAIQRAVVDNENNLDLLQATAVMRASHGETDQAIEVFRRILELDPENALALNNLATLLAEKPNQRAEALELIQRAMDIVGRRSMLLDTQGTIYFKLGDADSAIAALKEATAGGAADARYYLHLAAAYRLADRNADALRMLNEARAYGFERFVLTDDDRLLLQTLQDELQQLPDPAEISP
ncbi:MAG: tetratricopeptide repeat protein, partial [Aeoliella sp.]